MENSKLQPKPLPLCHICGGITEWEWTCRTCEELVCDNCTASYNQFTQIDYTLCSECHESDKD